MIYYPANQLKRIILTLVILIFGIRNAYPSNKIEISLLTCSSGQESYEAWGHSAIRVINFDNFTDLTYNFGLFDFSTPHFYLKFIQGKLKYQLGVHNTDVFIKSYVDEGRQVVEQKIDLSEENEKKIVDRLEYLYRPENRFYYYNFVRKNCTTELRDLIFCNIHSDFKSQPINKSFRDFLSSYLKEQPWTDLGINLAMGSEIDKRINPYESMFLPDILSRELNNVRIDGKNLVRDEIIYNENPGHSGHFFFFLTPTFIFSILALAILLSKSSTIQSIIFIIVGIAGLFLLLITLFTEHLELKNNFNLLWCNPLYLVLAILLLGNKWIKFQKFLSILLILFIVSMAFIRLNHIQNFEYGFLPIIIVLLISNLKILKKGALYRFKERLQ